MYFKAQILSALLLGLVTFSSVAEQVNVYSARNEALIKPVLDQFSEATGIEVNLITGKADALISRIKSEGQFSPADILLTTDAGRLVRAKQQGITQAFNSEVVQQYVDETLRDNEHHWFALTLRARPIMYVKGQSNIDGIRRYEDIADPEYSGSLCVRSSSNIYNQSMLAALIEQTSSDYAHDLSKGLVAHFARPPKGGDRDQIRALVAGQCDVAIANTYYLAGMLESPDTTERQIAQKVSVLWPNQQDRGTHVNISGAALIKTAPNAEAAKKLLIFLLEKNSQSWYANTNHEYPVRSDVPWSETLRKFGTFKSEEVELQRVGELNADALKVMDRAGWK